MPRSSKAPLPARSPDEHDLLLHFKQLTEVDLPARARRESWPIRFDHCFKRICLDYAFRDVWYAHLPRPAERHIGGPALVRAHGCARDLLAADPLLLAERNRESLGYRGKRGPRQPAGTASTSTAHSDASQAHPGQGPSPDYSLPEPPGKKTCAR